MRRKPVIRLNRVAIAIEPLVRRMLESESRARPVGEASSSPALRDARESTASVSPLWRWR